jgi:hypothetical protein
MCAYIHGVGFCIAYSDILVFLGPQTADNQKKRSAFFDVRNGIPVFHSISHLDNDPVNAGELLRWDFLYMKPQQSLIRRRKTYRDEEGVVVCYGAEEVYFVAKPRDYETHPLREGEIRNTSIFHRSMTEALAELSDPVRKAEWSKRWHAQLNEPEPDAPIERKSGKRHIYLRLDRYVQSVLQRQMRKDAGLPGTEK